ncbi:endo-1,4-beta-xylanase [Nocardiopsis salina]|uniref:endo-1,4-beta-xylanase n=1 Tax=Nocardiopsis salina TaxID=245836 RepID=UPI00034D5C05|nr:endo-1,4-beta-xylanase [Nocardiopsis salina]
MPKRRQATSITATALALALLPLAPGAAGEADLTLRDSAPQGFHIGSSVAGGGHLDAEDHPDPFTHDKAYTALLGQEFDSLTPENRMKWSELRPSEDTYDFSLADRIVEFAARKDQEVRGHALLWHQQNPDWLEEGDYSEQELRQILHEHVTTVVGRYKGRIHQWDVGNELIDDDSRLRTEENIWLRELGPEVISDVFRWAHAADPEAELFLNDYSIEDVNDKSDAYLDLVRELLADGVPVHGLSVQAHLTPAAGYPESMEENLDRFGDLGLRTALSEVDVRVETSGEGDGGTEEQLSEQADFYARALQACLNADSCTSFTVWGYTDRYSWIPSTFPGKGAGAIMDDDLKPKPAYGALRETLRSSG